MEDDEVGSSRSAPSEERFSSNMTLKSRICGVRTGDRSRKEHCGATPVELDVSADRPISRPVLTLRNRANLSSVGISHGGS